MRRLKAVAETVWLLLRLPFWLLWAAAEWLLSARARRAWGGLARAAHTEVDIKAAWGKELGSEAVRLWAVTPRCRPLYGQATGSRLEVTVGRDEYDSRRHELEAMMARHASEP